MKSKEICKVTPYLFENHLLLSLDAKWIEVFQGMPVFDVVIDEENRFTLVGPHVSAAATKDSLSEQEFLRDAYE